MGGKSKSKQTSVAESDEDFGLGLLEGLGPWEHGSPSTILEEDEDDEYTLPAQKGNGGNKSGNKAGKQHQKGSHQIQKDQLQQQKGGGQHNQKGGHQIQRGDPRQQQKPGAGQQQTKGGGQQQSKGGGQQQTKGGGQQQANGGGQQQRKGGGHQHQQSGYPTQKGAYQQQLKGGSQQKWDQGVQDQMRWPWKRNKDLDWSSTGGEWSGGGAGDDAQQRGGSANEANGQGGLTTGNWATSTATPTGWGKGDNKGGTAGGGTTWGESGGGGGGGANNDWGGGGGGINNDWGGGGGGVNNDWGGGGGGGGGGANNDWGGGGGGSNNDWGGGGGANNSWGIGEASGWKNTGGRQDQESQQARQTPTERGRQTKRQQYRTPTPAEHVKAAANGRPPSRTLLYAATGSATSILDGGVRGGPHTKVHIHESRGVALENATRALYSRQRPANQRIHWMFSPTKDYRVAALLDWVQALSHGLATFGLHKFLQTGQRGALIANASFRSRRAPDEPAFDWITFDDTIDTHDRTLQESIAFYDPEYQVLVFVFLLSHTGNSMAMWRRKLAVPNEVRMQNSAEITRITKNLSQRRYVVTVDELPAVPSDTKRKKKWFHVRW